ncbi:MAG: HAMP domain-containing sensor histidine kinase [Eubacteriales bacterium]|nr:HAMP domain-containing sensor histidine kinase [Eubacteriales bacterium]
MIRNFQQRLIVILTILLSLIFVGILVVFNYMNYLASISQQTREFRHTIDKVGLSAFCSDTSGDSRLDELEYAAVDVSYPGQTHILSNHLSNVSAAQLMKYCRKTADNNHFSGRIDSLIYVKKMQDYKKILIFTDTAEIMENTWHMILRSVAIGIFVIFFLFLLSVSLSRWLTSPVIQTLESQKQFISDASHELKTPLTVISSNVDLLEKEIGSNTRLQYIRQETTRMNHLVQEMLALVRMDNHRNVYHTKVSFSLSRTLMGIALPFESVAFEYGISLDIQIEEHLNFHGREEEFQQLLSILIDNAIRYTPAGGTITITARQQHRKIYLSVANTGEPIPPQIQEKIFDRFFRADESRENQEGHHGLGLAIAHSIVTQYHGKISVECKDGVTTFLVVLPV